MENIFRKIAQDTTKFNLGDEEGWRKLYEPLYAEVPDSIDTVKDEQYGPADLPNVEYPGGADDMQLAREWVFQNIEAAKYGRGSPEKVVLLGHSSGGAHIATNLYAAGDPKRKPKASIFPPVAGVIYLSVPFWFDRTKPVRQKVIRHYYGSDSEAVWGPLSPLGLFKSLPEGSPLLDSEQLPVYIGSVKWEVKETADATVAFFNAYRERSLPLGTLPVFHVQDNHNHVSNVLSIGTADSAQAEKLLEFMKSCVEKVDQRTQRTHSVDS
ncbi:alpha/beta-hydrolase [Penicillium daleae]|uniref:Alpha/beta-hydrolase n=1 Tax=Penicillium daleae TaxID=63821 RepID=A0AAD6FYT6_9EURO|nr:alpha/beta-hydrolase [Penicillium daleae]KAJ5438131.1 alpha/beta-hydrolase [Penicillium daleae]